MSESESHSLVEFVLDSVSEIMSGAGKKPKVLLFDIGGVCVVSPMKGILEYELSHNIPPGWINHAISASSPTGFWQRLERGEIPMDAAFFAGFNHDLHNARHWERFYLSRARTVGIQIERKDIPPVPDVDGAYMFNKMMTASREPDPWMWPALKKLKASGEYLIAALSNTMIFPDDHPLSAPPPSDQNVKAVFDVFISSAHAGLRKPDPAIYAHALAEINTYALAHSKADGKRRTTGWENGVKAGEVLFLDDIGENLKAGRRAGFGTVKVPLGRAYEAVAELERITGLELDGGWPKVSSAPVIPKAKL